jgi:hypothetical protein
MWPVGHPFCDVRTRPSWNGPAGSQPPVKRAFCDRRHSASRKAQLVSRLSIGAACAVLTFDVPPKYLSPAHAGLSFAFIAQWPRVGLHPADDGCVATIALSPAADQWQTRTGIEVCVRTFVVTPPSTTAAIPLLPCEVITIRSQPFSFAVATIAW